MSRVAFNNRVLSPLVALVKDGAARRGVPVRDELERVLRAAYLSHPTPAPTAPSAASNLLAAPTLAGQRVQIVVDGSGVIVTGVVVAAIPLAAVAPLAPIEQPREARPPYCDEPGQDIWP